MVGAGGGACVPSCWAGGGHRSCQEPPLHSHSFPGCLPCLWGPGVPPALCCGLSPRALPSPGDSPQRCPTLVRPSRVEFSPVCPFECVGPAFTPRAASHTDFFSGHREHPVMVVAPQTWVSPGDWELLSPTPMIPCTYS